jgi:hypothetical protein
MSGHGERRSRKAEQLIAALLAQPTIEAAPLFHCGYAREPLLRLLHLTPGKNESYEESVS